MDFVFEFSPDKQYRTCILAFVKRSSKMVHIAPVSARITA